MAINVKIRPKDREWIMGDDLVLEVNAKEMTLVEFFYLISETKKIPKSRFRLVVSSIRSFEFRRGVVYDNSNNDRGDWTVKRAGIHSKLILIVQPIFPLAWLWHDIEWYEDNYIDYIREAIISSSNQKLTLQQIAKTTKKPPPIFSSLRCFLRRFPDIFYMEVNQNNGFITVSINHSRKLIPGIVWLRRTSHSLTRKLLTASETILPALSVLRLLVRTCIQECFDGEATLEASMHGNVTPKKVRRSDP